MASRRSRPRSRRRLQRRRAHAFGARRPRQAPRSPWWRCAPTAGSSRWSAASDYARQPVQPRHPGAAPARLDLQAVRLSRRAARRHDARTTVIDDRPVDDRRLDAARTTAAAIAARSRCARPSRCRATSPPSRLSERVGARTVIARRARPRRRQPARTSDPSLALGTSGVTLLELTAAYAAVAAGALSGPRRAASWPPEQAGWLAEPVDAASRQLGAIARSTRCANCSAPSSPRAPAGRAALSVPTFGKTGTTPGQSRRPVHRLRRRSRRRRVGRQ